MTDDFVRFLRDRLVLNGSAFLRADELITICDEWIAEMDHLDELAEAAYLDTMEEQYRYGGS